MLDKIYDPFLEATRNVFQLMLDLADIQSCPADAFDCDEELDIAIGITGDLTGSVVYRFPRQTSLNMVNIMSGMEVDRVDDFVTSAIAEIANIISGNVLTLLAEGNLACNILPPELRGPDESNDYSLHSICCIGTSVGEVGMNIQLNPAP